MTLHRFAEYTGREEDVWKRFLNTDERIPNFAGISEKFKDYDMHPEGTEAYDLCVNNLRIKVTVDIQENNNFEKWGDLRLDFVSVYTPDRLFRTYNEFRASLDATQISVEKWGKIVEPQADYLVVEFRQCTMGELWPHSPHRIYSLQLPHDHLNYWITHGIFRTNIKRDTEETWGSAFIAIKREDENLRATEPCSLMEMEIPIREWIREFPYQQEMNRY